MSRTARMLRRFAIALALLLVAGAMLAAGVAAAAGKPPLIKLQPTSVAVDEGQSATFEATASGTPPPTVQWEVSTDGGSEFTPIAGATSDQLTIADVSIVESGNEYHAVFTNSLGKATTQAATLTVRTPPRVTQQPSSVTAEEGHNATFEAAASGDPAPTVYWQISTDGAKHWTSIAGATSDQLTVSEVTTAMNGWEYRAVFESAAGAVVSEAATLSVVRRPSVTKQPVSVGIEEGQNASFEATGAGFPAPTVQWEVSSDAGASWSPIAGATSDRLTVTAATTAMNGWEYRALFTNAAGSIASHAATLTVSALPFVTQQPAGATVEVGETAEFEATASGTPPPTVQWQISTNSGASWSAVGGATSDRLAVTTRSVGENGYEYRALFTNVAGSTASEAATLTVTTNSYAAVGWGRNLGGDLGDGVSGGSSDVPVSVQSLRFVTAVAAGAEHTLALLADGKVMAWGANHDGQLGAEEEGFASSVPVEVVGLTAKATAIAAGAGHSLALLSNGTVMAWGDNENGQLGTGATAEAVETPAAVRGLTNVKAIAAGGESSLALLDNGTVMAWGNNESGQLGIGSRKGSDVPVAIKGLTGVKAIAVGDEFSLALLENGTVVAWGSDASGQLDDAAAAEAGLSEEPVPVESLSGVTAIAAGARHALAITGGGAVMAWGEDSFGELGNGTMASQEETPVAVSGLSGATAIAAGEGNSVALVGSGSLMSWGDNHYGELGNGGDTTSDVPVGVVGLNSAVGIAAGGDHVVAYGEPLPAVTGVSPDSGPNSGGGTVTISGASFTGATAVDFGSAKSHFSVESAHTIIATVPAGSGVVDVTVTTPVGTSGPTAQDRYTYRAPPSVKKLLTKSGPATGGTSVTIEGSEFTGATSVSFGAVSTHEFTVNSATSITVISPLSPVSGRVYVTVTGPGGTSAAGSKGRFEYIPTVEGVAPATGSTLGGTSVTVSGNGFALGSATKFDFGTVKAQSVDCTSSTSCTVLSPAQAAGTVNVRATVGKFTSAIDAPGDQFEYN